MSAATLTRPSNSGYAGFAEPVRAVRPLAAPGPLALDRRAPERPILPPLPPRARRTRITRRGRLVLLVLAVGLLLAAISVGRAGSQAATATETGPALTQTTVQQGETLWTVAQRIAPHNDPRDVIAQIRRINHLQSSSLRVGQQLLLPVPSR
jgi:hypothetical protein